MNPRLKARRIDLEGKYFEVRHDELIHQDGRESRYHYIKVLFSWVLVVVRAQDPLQRGYGSILFVHQYRHPAGGICFDLPGGMVDPGESPIAAAHRELFEETGYRTERLRSIGSVSPFGGMVATVGEIFLAEGVLTDTGIPHLDAGEEGLSHIWISRAEIHEMLRCTPHMIGGPSLAAIMMADVS